ncbi:PD-(D/E)XK nuclease superfamily protein [Thomasclavelia cocleata]|uniref:PD-(D/E)XK nuclease superfamily protein n=1 Tax=Thomasclavelia cocleata TaxID=69824 RepID=A0A1I0CXI2_9FIRM|nr:AAA family ATPase [Thomasclavelia cocleata]SET24297.1 PD-(D/E)XK nuclease superfamily protein [Thomasclavelia cocleata]
MKKRIPVGLKDYEKLRNENYYVVDKTLMIKDFLERGNEVTLITRPRRFGKTINISMMAEFFDITKNSKKLFKNTKIINTEYVSEMNQYPTVFISFADAKGDKDIVTKHIKSYFRSLYNDYDFIFKNLTRLETYDYETIIHGLTNEKIELKHISDSLAFLMRILEKYYNKKVMIFIDEYDTPFIEAHLGGFYEEIRDGLSSILHNALKTSTSLQYAMMTGIQRVAKENIFSDLNNLVVCTVKDPEYAQYFGFTEEETKEALEYYDMSLNSEVKSMFNGYHFGNNEIYDPWSVLNYASRKVLEPYWINTSSNEMIKKAMESSDDAFNRGYEELIQTGKLETLVRMETSFFEMNSTSSLWGLLVNAGYLTISKIISNQEGLYVIKVPNQEVQQEFQKLTAHYLKVAGTDLFTMFSALKRRKKEDFKDKYQRILLTLPSYHDLKDENSYHMMALGMCAWLCHDYKIISNREAGKGRCDIILKARKENQVSYILEFKYAKDSNPDLKELAKTAVEQIKDRKYDTEISGKIIYIGLAHYQKNIEIEWQEK